VRRRRFWGWGWDDAGPTPAHVQAIGQLLAARFSIDPGPLHPEPRLDQIDLAPPRVTPPSTLASRCSAAPFDRAGHTYGKSFRDIVRGLRGDFRNAPDLVAFPETTADVTALLRRRHRIRDGEDDDFMVRTLEEMARVLSATTNTLRWLLASIAAVSLLVGGIGIMNIMLVSVTERTREVGLRLAVGARDVDVLLQFLVEAIVLSMAGGGMGVAVGMIATRVLSQVMGWSAPITVGAVALAFGFSTVIGVFFGFYPARKAASLDPIAALRYE